MPDLIHIRKVHVQADLDQVFAIRKQVFVHEQQCPPELEWEFEEESIHFLALYEGQPAGAARWRKTDKGYKLERFAVLKECRDKGLGKALVQAVLADLPEDASYIYLHAQTHARDFYERLGFRAVGDEFEEAGIRHFKMTFKRPTAPRSTSF